MDGKFSFVKNPKRVDENNFMANDFPPKVVKKFRSRCRYQGEMQIKKANTNEAHLKAASMG